MKLSSVLVLAAAVAASAVNASETTGVLGVPEVNTAPSTELGNPMHITHHTEDIAVGVPVSVGHPRASHDSKVGVPVSFDHPHHQRWHHHGHGHHHHKDSSSSSAAHASSSSSDSADDIVQKSPDALAIEKLLRIYGHPDKIALIDNNDLPTPAPTKSVTPAPTVPTPAPTYTVTPSPTVPSHSVTPAPTVPTPAPTTFALSPSAAKPDTNNPYIKQIALPTETPVATLAVETRTPERLRDSAVVGRPLTSAPNALAASEAATTEDSSSSIAVPAVLLGCVAAALAVAMAVFVHKKRTQRATTTSPTVGEELDYKNEMVTPV